MIQNKLTFDLLNIFGKNLTYSNGHRTLQNFPILVGAFTLVEAAGKFSMLHPCKHSKFLINIENTQSTHEEIL